MMHYKFNGKLKQRGNPDYSGEPNQATGLYYYGARYYDPQISMWYGVDPKAGKYPNWTPYAYCYGNPIYFVDIDGKYGYPASKKASYTIIY
jgi:RHS repeat-associated protein